VKYRTFLFGLVFLLCISFVFGLNVPTDVILGKTLSYTEIDGINITMNVNARLDSLNIATTSGALRCYIYNSTEKYIANATISSYVADFVSQNITLIAGRKYLVGCDRNGLAYNMAYNNTANGMPPLPIVTSYLNFTGGFYVLGGFGSVPNQLQNIVSINITLIIADEPKMTLKNQYNGTNINIFTANITNSLGTTTITTTNGTIYFDYGGISNITIFNVTNYFEQTFFNVNGSIDYEGYLVPSIFPIMAQTNKSRTPLINLSATIYNSTFSYSNSTTTGTLYLPYSYGLTYFINVSAPFYATTNTTISNINATFNYTYFLYENNSMSLTIYDAKTNKILNFTTITIQFYGSNTSTFVQSETSNGTFLQSYLDADYYTISLFNDDYYQQDYFVTLQDNEHKDITAYLLNSSFVAVTTIKIINPVGDNIENALITLQELISGTWTTISQKYTDTTGNSLFYLKISTQYRALVDKINYSTQIATITPSTNPYAVTILLSDLQDYTYSLSSDCLNYFIWLPKQIYANYTTFGVFVHSPNSALSYFGLYYNSTLFSNITTATGGTTYLNVNFTNETGSKTIGIFYKCSGLIEYWENATFYLQFGESVNNSISSIVSGIGDEIQNDATINDALKPMFKTGLILFIILVVLLIAFDLGIPTIAYGIIITIILTIFTIPPLAWINPILTISLGVILIGGSIITIMGDGLNYG